MELLKFINEQKTFNLNDIAINKIAIAIYKAEDFYTFYDKASEANIRYGMSRQVWDMYITDTTTHKEVSRRMNGFVCIAVYDNKEFGFCDKEYYIEKGFTVYDYSDVNIIYEFKMNEVV